MPVAFDTLQRASFNGHVFPVEEMSVNGEIRDFIHEFPHTNGGQPEKLGRKNYIVTMSCPFYVTFPAYPNLWPETLDLIKDLFEGEATALLHVPTIGKINAYIRSFKRVASSRNLAGEHVEITFVEDDILGFAVTALTASGTSGIKSQTEELTNKLNAATFEDKLNAQKYKDDAVAINSAVDAFLGARDSVDIFGSKVESSILRVQQTCEAIDRSLKLNDPGTAPVIEALHALWQTAINIDRDLKNKHTDLQTYVVPSTMSISQVSTALYGDTSHAVELLNLNAIDDALSIRPNTRLRYYPA